jgi:hypothetical protein
MLRALERRVQMGAQGTGMPLPLKENQRTVKLVKYHFAIPR